MKLTEKGVFWISLGIWVFILLPYFVPALNVINPKILNLPFTVFWQYFAIVVHTVLLFFSNKYVWDAFDADDKESDK